MLATQMPRPLAATWHLPSTYQQLRGPPSPSSSDSSSEGSVFSVDAKSQSSDSSVGSLNVGSCHIEDSWIPRNNSNARINKINQQQTQPLVIPAESVNRRRCSASQAPRPPPSLTRGTEKKGQFVEHLVDSAANMVEIVWPTSSPACFRVAALQQPHLSLRTFIQETLRRSRTSFSTLQVALYYLLLIRSFVPKYDFTMEQPVDSHSVRALQCGRRMFLAALILASKYLQDRNYSARAWSKISGLPVCEINTNEMAFLQAIDWKLHIPESTFDKWQTILIRFTAPSLCSIWKHLVLNLSPCLDKLPRAAQDILDLEGMDFGSNMARNLRQSISQASSDAFSPMCSSPVSPVCRPGPPVVLEPNTSLHTPPRHAPLAALPTPNFTPASSVCSTPAASLANFCQKPSAMMSAMSMAQNASMARTVMDNGAMNRNGWAQSLDSFRLGQRRPSAQFSVEYASASSPGSPGSMISDHSSQFSRSSSISSISSSQTSPTRSRDLARLAAFNWGQKIPEVDTDVVVLSSAPLTASPELDVNLQIEPADLYIPPHAVAAAAIQGKKRHRSITSTQQLDLQSQVRGLLHPSVCNQLRPQPSNAVASRIAETRYPVQVGNKRVRYAGEEMAMQPTLQENIIRPSGGPGMWKGIL